MSAAIELAELAEAIAKFRFAYLLTIGGDGRPHALAVQSAVAGQRITVTGLGERSRSNAAARSAVTLLWPPADIDGYSLIVDGDAELAEETLAMTPTRAVLHRPAPSPRPDSPCKSDCVELPVSGNN